MFHFSHVLLTYPTLSFIRISHQVVISAHVSCFEAKRYQGPLTCPAPNRSVLVSFQRPGSCTMKQRRTPNLTLRVDKPNRTACCVLHWSGFPSGQCALQ